jgi:hypothetical protein
MAMRSSTFFCSATAFLFAAGFLIGCGGDAQDSPEAVSSLSYKGHENDFDSNALAQAYPVIFGTRVDDCQTCHTGGEISDDKGKTSKLNPCSFCHLIPFPDATLIAGVPEDYQATLNPYGLDYKKAGRNVDALRSIEGKDSDGDSHTNAEELADLRFPGDPDSKPGQPTLPVHTFSREELEQLQNHEQFLLMNSHKQQYDSYAVYRGVKMKDLLAASGADLSAATSITCIAPDGFATDFPVEAVHTLYPPGVYHSRLGLDDFNDPNQGVVHYPEAGEMPAGLEDGGEIPGEHWLMVAFDRDGTSMAKSRLDPATGKLEGEGAYRLIAPQTTPGAPDRGSKYSPSGFDDGYDYDDGNDHNAGLCVRGLVAIRVNPIPAGYEEFDWKNGGWSLVERGELIVYGAGITEGSEERE